MNIKDIIEEISKNPNFEVKKPNGYPKIFEQHVLPNDVKEFYTYCGGISCYVEDGGFPIVILEPKNVKPANMFLLGEVYESDISSSWYIIADADDGNYISIDFNINRLGRCYESFEYSHAIDGNCPIVALSFSEMLINILNYKGEYFYWKDKEFFNEIGDAYHYDIK